MDAAEQEGALTADAFRTPAATTQRVAPRTLPQPSDAVHGADETPVQGTSPPEAAATAEAPPGPVQAQVAATVRGYEIPEPAPFTPVSPASPRPEPAPAPVHLTAAPVVPVHAAEPELPQYQGPLSFGEFHAAAEAKAPASPAEWGWRGRVRRLSGGLLTPSMSRVEAAHKAATTQVQASFAGPKTIVFVNPKGGATTTTSTLLAGRTFGTLRGGGVVAWDNNETRGTLGGRAKPAGHLNTARELLDNMHLFEHSASARIGDLGLYLRGQGGAHFDVLASDERAEVTGHIDAHEVGQLHALFERFYRLILIDTGNNMRAANWLASVHRADLLVVTTTVRQDSASAALWMLDALEKNLYGPGRLKPRVVTLLTEPAPDCDPSLRRMMINTFGARTRNVMPIPYDPALVDGGVVNHDRLSSSTNSAWLLACAAMAEALEALPARNL